MVAYETLGLSVRLLFGATCGGNRHVCQQNETSWHLTSGLWHLFVKLFLRLIKYFNSFFDGKSYYNTLPCMAALHQQVSSLFVCTGRHVQPCFSLIIWLRLFPLTVVMSLVVTHTVSKDYQKILWNKRKLAMKLVLAVRLVSQQQVVRREVLHHPHHALSSSHSCLTRLVIKDHTILQGK